MGPLIALVAAVQALVAPQEALDSASQWESLVAEASRRFDVPSQWIWRVMSVESGGKTMLEGRPITSPKGAMGLMQLMPATYADMALRYGLGSDPYLPRDNIQAGAAYLRLMYERFGFPGMFAAYNAGPERYEAWLHGGKPLPAETRNYLARITSRSLPKAGQLAAQRAGSRPAPPGIAVFFVLSGQGNKGDFHAANGADSAPQKRSGNGIFVPLHDPEAQPE